VRCRTRGRTGAPLRVGDKVVFTGCEDQTRDRLEKRSESLGVRVLGSVSPKTVMLVSDGTMAGTTLAKAHELGTRIVHPDTYEVLLRHLQPAQPRPTAVSNGTASQPAGEGTLTILSAGPGPDAEPAVARGNPAEIRRWARENGWVVGDRGRLPAPLLDAYAAAHRNDLPEADAAPV
jgi:DNA polymerase-3 subunit epsilon